MAPLHVWCYSEDVIIINFRNHFDGSHKKIHLVWHPGLKLCLDFCSFVIIPYLLTVHIPLSSNLFYDWERSFGKVACSRWLIITAGSECDPHESWEVRRSGPNQTYYCPANHCQGAAHFNQPLTAKWCLSLEKLDIWQSEEWHK